MSSLYFSISRIVFPLDFVLSLNVVLALPISVSLLISLSLRGVVCNFISPYNSVYLSRTLHIPLSKSPHIC